MRENMLIVEWNHPTASQFVISAVVPFVPVCHIQTRVGRYLSKVSEGLPEGFSWATLGSCCFIFSGGMLGCEPPFYRDDFLKKGEGTPFYRGMPGLGPSHSTNPRKLCFFSDGMLTKRVANHHFIETVSQKKVRAHHFIEKDPGLGPSHSTDPHPNFSNQIEEIRGPSEPF